MDDELVGGEGVVNAFHGGAECNCDEANRFGVGVVVGVGWQRDETMALDVRKGQQ